MRFKFSFLLILFILGSLVSPSRLPASSNNTSKLVITSSAFKKISIYVPEFKGESSIDQNFSQILRRALNYHLFVLATPFKPISFDANTYELLGELKKQGNFIILKASLFKPAINLLVKKYFLKGPSRYPYLLAYYLCDQVIKEISGYQGVAFTKVAFVKRTRLGDRLYIADFIKAHPRCIDHSKLILFPKFSFKGDKIAYLTYSPKGYILNIFDFKTLKKHTFFIRGICSTPVWAPGGKLLYLTLSRHGKIGIYSFNLETRQLTPVLVGHGLHQASSVSRDGEFLTYVYDLGVNKPKVYVLNLKTKKRFRISAEGYDTCPRFSPKGDTVAYISKRASGNYLVFVNLTNNARKEVPLPVNIKYFCFSPTGDYILACSQNGIYLLHLDSGLYFLYLPGRGFLYPTWTKL